LNELWFWTLSVVWCLKNWGIKNIYQISQYTRPQNSNKGQLLTTEPLTWVHTHINPWSKSDTGGNKWPNHCSEFCGRLFCDIWYIFLIPHFLRHQTMDKVLKHNSFNTNTPSSESYRNYFVYRLTEVDSQTEKQLRLFYLFLHIIILVTLTRVTTCRRNRFPEF
jgi:hypothetical protein